MSWKQTLEKAGPGHWVLPKTKQMRCEAHLFLSDDLLFGEDGGGGVEEDVFGQVVNACSFPGATRVVLTPSHLHVHRGFWSDDIALGSITRVAVEDLSPWSSNASLLALVLGRQRDYASFGVREVLRVEWTDAKGRARTTWVRFEGADAFRAQIEGLRGGATGVRVADDDVAAAGLDDVAADAEAEREARRRG